jgi:hypothetical protein
MTKGIKGTALSNLLNSCCIWDFVHGAEAYEFEQKVLRENAFDQYRGSAILRSGNDELFLCDVLSLDNGDYQLKLAIAA